MSTNELAKLFEQAEQTAEYQFESAVVDITEEICEIMEAKGVSRADLARQLGKSRAWVTKMLSGDQNMTLKTVVDILWALDYRLEMKTKPIWSDTKAWTQNVDAFVSESVVRVYSSQSISRAAARYKEAIETAPEATNVSDFAA